MLSGYSTKGSKACPTCGEETDYLRLHHGKKEIYMGHRKWLPNDHIFRTWRSNFNGSTEYRRPPKPMTGLDCLEATNTLTFQLGKGKENGSTRKRKRVQNNDNTEYTGPWRKQSVFFQLPYWKNLLLRHNLDVMHVEKNVTDSVIGTLLGIDGKNKDSLKARLDMVLMGIKHSLHPQPRGGRTWLPPAKYTLSNDEKTLICKIFESVRVSDGFSSNIRRCVRIAERKLVGLKSHDCHIIMQYLLPVAIRHALQPDIAKVLLELSAFFRQLCTKVGTVDHFRDLSNRIAETLCKLEMLMPPSFFDIMVHLLIHLADEAAIAGPVQFRWMYPIERYLHDLKKYVRNRSQPEGSIAEGYIIEECLSFCTMYLSDGVESKRTRIGRNADDPDIVPHIEEKVQRKEDVDPDIRALAIGPSKDARRFNKYIMNGFRFFVKSIDAKSKTQNCGVFVKAEVSSYARAGDHRPRDGVKDYYGVLTDIIELDYHHGRKVLLFDCDWADNRVRNRAVKMDEYGFILVNFDHLLPKPDTLILASQAVQFFYIQDPTQPAWHTVIRTRPRDLFDMGTDIEPEPYDTQNLVNNDDGITRTDVDGVLVDGVIE
ncbi:uncharacterized protein LOC133732598 [Rosa rugosa]|uniref:uncharacterized protein LOC133732598 n=1 Tax=Rosa rugosa TaxID=74645 RepID=UPI002B4147E1|nr:uncharacterized protein LOC133732598 [Rosa rugosa]